MIPVHEGCGGDSMKIIVRNIYLSLYMRHLLNTLYRRAFGIISVLKTERHKIEWKYDGKTRLRAHRNKR